MPDEPKPASPPAQPTFQTDSTSISMVYTNFCRVNVTPEEMVLDFGLNPRLTPDPSEPIKLTHRVVMNFFTAKRLLIHLNAVIRDHEQMYGPLELDIQKRVRGKPAAPTPAKPAAGAAPPGTGPGPKS
jgi:hypothetical protein